MDSNLFIRKSQDRFFFFFLVRRQSDLLNWGKAAFGKEMQAQVYVVR